MAALPDANTLSGERHPLAAQPQALFLAALARQRDASAGGHHAVPRQIQAGMTVAQGPTYPAGRAAASDGFRNVAVSGDFPRRDFRRGAVDRLADGPARRIAVGSHRPECSHNSRAARPPRPATGLLSAKLTF